MKNDVPSEMEEGRGGVEEEEEEVKKVAYGERRGRE